MARYSYSQVIFNQISKNADKFVQQVHKDFGSGRQNMIDAIMMYACTRRGTATTVVDKMTKAGIQF